MCSICDKLDSMIDCLESLHSPSELKQALSDMTDDLEVKSKINSMSDSDIYIEFSIKLMIHWASKYDGCPFDVLSTAVAQFEDRIHAHSEEDEDE